MKLVNYAICLLIHFLAECTARIVELPFGFFNRLGSLLNMRHLDLLLTIGYHISLSTIFLCWLCFFWRFFDLLGDAVLLTRGFDLSLFGLSPVARKNVGKPGSLNIKSKLREKKSLWTNATPVKFLNGKLEMTVGPSFRTMVLSTKAKSRKSPSPRVLNMPP